MNNYAVGAYFGFCISLILILFFEFQVPNALHLVDANGMAAWAQALAAGLSLPISLFSAYLIFKTVQESRRMSSITQDMFYNQRTANYQSLRPWVSLDQVETIVKDGSDTNDLILRVTLKNYGNTTALDVRSNLEIYRCVAGTYSYGSPITMQRSGFDPTTGVTKEVDFSVKFALTPGSSFSFLSRSIQSNGAGSIGCCLKVEYNSTLAETVEQNSFFISYREINGKLEFRGDYGDATSF